MHLYVFFFIQSQHTKSNSVQPDQHIANMEIVVYLLGCISVPKKFTEDI